MSSRAGSLWRQIFNVQCPYKRKASVKATRASLCYSEPCWLFAFADMYGVAELSHFSQIKPKLVMSFSMFAQFWSWSKTISTHFTRDSLWASSIYGPPLQIIWPKCFSWDRALVVVASYQLALCIVGPLWPSMPLGYHRLLGPLGILNVEGLLESL